MCIPTISIKVKTKNKPCNISDQSSSQYNIGKSKIVLTPTVCRSSSLSSIWYFMWNGATILQTLRSYYAGHPQLTVCMLIANTLALYSFDRDWSVWKSERALRVIPPSIPSLHTHCSANKWKWQKWTEVFSCDRAKFYLRPFVPVYPHLYPNMPCISLYSIFFYPPPGRAHKSENRESLLLGPRRRDKLHFHSSIAK